MATQSRFYPHTRKDPFGAMMEEWLKRCVPSYCICLLEEKLRRHLSQSSKLCRPASGAAKRFAHTKNGQSAADL
jgi:hypothetical protein